MSAMQLATQRPNKALMYVAIVCGLVVAWHLIWIISFGSLAGFWQTCANMKDSMRDSSYRLRGWVPLYFELFPFAILAIAMMFVWNARELFGKHPFGFLAVIGAAISPIILANYFRYFIRHAFF